MLSSLTLNPPPFPSGHYSALLHCSLLAFAAALSDDPFINQRATRERFAQHAKQLLEEELHRPSITLAQSLVMLSEYHRGAGEREKAYMYMGMSARAVRAISSKGGELPQGERTEFVPQGNNILRAWNFWSMFSQDKLMSLEYKSDFELASPRTNAFPSWGDLNIDQGLWYNNPTLGSASGTAHNSRVTEVFDQSCRLMRIAEDILVAIYSKARSGLTPEEEEAMNLHRKLEVWMNGLLPELLISDSPNTFATPLPHIIVLNICYWWLILLVHQPFYGALLDNVSFVDLSIKQCDHAARMIVKLVNLYSYWHPLRFFPRNVVQAIFAAGTMFLQQCTLLPINANEAHANAQMGIQNCIDALRIISQTWESVERLVVQLEARCQTEIGLIFT